MKIHRREFIKFSGISGVALLSGLPAFSGFFNDIPSAEQNFISLCGICPDPNSIGEKGIHLRWALPPSKGFPEKMIVYRRKSSEKASNMLMRLADSNETYLPAKKNDISFIFQNSQRLRIANTNQGRCYENLTLSATDKLKIVFDYPVDYCRIQLGVINPLTIKGYYADGTVASTVIVSTVQTYSSFSITGDGKRKVKYIELPLNFKHIYFLEYYHQEFACSFKDWEKAGEIDNVKDIITPANGELVFKRLLNGAFNYYLPTALPTDPKREVYKKQSEYYQRIIKGMSNPSTENFIVQPPYTQLSQIPADELIFKNKNKNNLKINAWNFLMLHALDPNIARMMGLYFVDSIVKVEENAFYDYKIVAYYKDKKELCGIVQQIPGKYAGKPELINDISATQTGNTWWEFDTQLRPLKHSGKVRLSWAGPKTSIHPYLNPVVYGFRKNSSNERVISPGRNKAKGLFYVDQEAVVSATESKYEIRGIDLFGQTSYKISTGQLVKDKDNPPPPYKLTFGDYNNAINLFFEYGTSQYLAAPDAQSFTIYKKPDTLISTHDYKYNLEAEFTQNDEGNKIRTITLQSYNGSDGEFQFVRFIKNQNGQGLPAISRKKFKIDYISAGKLMFTCGIEYDPLAVGWVECVKDPAAKNNNGWSVAATKQSSPPIYGQLINYINFISNSNDTTHYRDATIPVNKSFTCKAVLVFHIPPSEAKDLFETTASINNEEHTEVLIDRQILISGLFSRCRVKTNTTTRAIVQSAGIAAMGSELAAAIALDPRAKNKYARILFRGNVTVSPGDNLYLHLPHKADTVNVPNKLSEWIIARVSISLSSGLNPGGELLLKGRKTIPILNDDGSSTQTDEDILLTATVGSDFYDPANTPSDNYKEVLLFIDKRIKSFVTPGPLVYFAPYAVSIQSIVQSLTLLKTEAHKSLYFAVDTKDNANPVNTSPLSIIAQFIKTRNADDKPDTPQTPFPCGHSTATEAYLNPSNSEGRSTFCIEWNDIKDSAGTSKGYRYEVARSLDKTIIAVHKDLWLKGMDHPAPANSTIAVSGLQRNPANATTGVIEARFINTEAREWNDYKGGRLKQGTGVNVKGFEIIAVSKNGNQVNLSLRPMIKGTSPAIGTAAIDILPAYQKIHDDPVLLKGIIDLCPSAFSIVTGQPLRNANKFLDDVPGMGSSRFFYKVRSVDASEIRSEWSPASVAVWQVKGELPEMLLSFDVEVGDRLARLVWRNVPLHKTFSKFEVYRFNTPPAADWIIGNSTPIASITFNAENSGDYPYKKIVARNGIITIPAKLTIPIQQNLPLLENFNASTIGLRYLDGNQQNLYNSNDFSVLYKTLEDAASIAITGIKIKNNAAIIEDMPLTISANNINVDRDKSLLAFEDRTVVGGKEYYYSVRAVMKLPQGSRMIKGQPTAAIRIKAIDKSKPVAPALILAWIALPGSTNGIMCVRISFTQNNYKRIYLQRKKSGEQQYEKAVVGDQKGWISLNQSGNTTIQLIDQAAIQSNGWIYIAMIETTDGRMSDYSIEKTILR
ncbi:MAG: hypothetical protein EOP48_00785 [Sphingobacteriales bacterium]|nr:MAG: hypothetical protein EOP48_00785 [Sphingobacteriales bacterium]